MGAQQSSAVLPESELPSLEERLSHHAVLRDYRIEAPLEPGSGRFMKTYRIRRKKKTDDNNNNTGTIKNMANEEVTAVLKTGWIWNPPCNNNTTSTTTTTTTTTASTSATASATTHNMTTTATATTTPPGAHSPDSASSTSWLQQQQHELFHLRQTLSTQPHIAPYLCWYTDNDDTNNNDKQQQQQHQQYQHNDRRHWRAFYLLRPHFYTTLATRLESRPFLDTAEKIFLGSQLLQALAALHAAGLVHGFLTTSNVALTAAGWLVLVDVAAYVTKESAVLAADDPLDFLYYFAAKRRKQGTTTTTTTSSSSSSSAATTISTGQRCYLAPERFGEQQQQQQQQTTTADSPNNNNINNNNNSPCTTTRTKLTPAMDIFSAGCVLTEMFLNGEACLELGDLLEYKAAGALTPAIQQKLQKVERSAVRAACKHMLQLDATQRLSAAAYWERWMKTEEQAFPHEILTNLVQKVTTTTTHQNQQQQATATTRMIISTPDARLAWAAEAYGNVLWECVGVRDVQGQAYFEQVLGFPVEQEKKKTSGGGGGGGWHKIEQDLTERMDTAVSSSSSFNTSNTQSLLHEAEALLAQLDALQLNDASEAQNKNQSLLSDSKGRDCALSTTTPETVERSALSKSSLLIYLQVIAATVPHVQRPASKLVALQLLKRLAKYSSDEARLQRIVPVAVSLLQDQDVLVKASAVQVLTHTLSIVETFPPSDSQIFSQYIFKRVGHLISDPSLVVRLAFAQCIAVLAETAQRFLDITHAVRLYEAVGAGNAAAGGAANNNNNKSSSDAQQDHEARSTTVFDDNVHKLLDNTTDSSSSRVVSLADPNHTSTAEGFSVESTTTPKSEASSVIGGRTLISSTYKVELTGLQETVSRWVVQLATDQSNHASFSKRAVLRDLGRLCAFFGLDGVMAFILPQILAFLNERRDWELRSTLFEVMPYVCNIIGRAATEEYVLPCVEIGLVDGEEQVVSRALLCLAELVELGLLSRFAMVGGTSTAETKTSKSCLLAKYGVLLLHPSEDIRNSAISAFSAMCKSMGPLDTEVYAIPYLAPFLRFKPTARSMLTVAGFERCLAFPWSRDKLLQELNLMTSSAQRLPQTSGAWTSIGISVSKHHQSIEPNHDLPDGKEDSQTQDTELHVQRFRDYLSMFLKHTASFPSQERANLGANTTMTGIEGSLKLSQNIMFPKQNGRDQRGVIPKWFDDLRDEASGSRLGVSADSAIRSVSALGQVYGLSIMGPAGGTTDGVVDAADGGVDDADETLDAANEGKQEMWKEVLHSTESLNIEAAFAGRWGSETTLDPEVVDTCLLLTKLKSVCVPPLPPQLGGETASRRPPPGKDPSSAKTWKPKMNAMVATSSTATGHTAPVVRLAVSVDQKFFVSGSHDGTCRVWEIPQIDDSNGILESCATYTGHLTGGQVARINDVAMLEGSHSVVSGASNGTIRVWRVDLIASAKGTSHQTNSSKVGGTGEVQKMNPAEGEILAVSHFNTLSGSVMTYATQKGFVHSWDLRCAQEPFSLKHDPSLGNLSALALGSDRNWLVTGTSNGFITLWDVRFQQPVKLWKHSRSSSISRLATSYVLSPQQWPSGDTAGGARPFIFVASGPNECGMFDVLSGHCQGCFRVVEGDGRNLNNYVADPPVMNTIRIASQYCGNVAKPSQSLLPRTAIPSSSINCMVGSVGAGEHSYLLTGGCDSSIRFWDFSVPSKCFVVSGNQQGQPRPGFERMDFDGSRRLMLCRESPLLGLRDTNAKATKQFRGLKKPEHYHKDSIEDLRIIDNSSLISSSRDCTVKVWR